MNQADVALRPGANVVLTEMRDGTGVLLDLDTKFYFSLNRSGLVAWKTLEAAGPEGARAADLAQTLHDTFEVTLEQAGTDVQVLLDGLRQEKLVVPAAGEGG